MYSADKFFSSSIFQLCYWLAALGIALAIGYYAYTNKVPRRDFDSYAGAGLLFFKAGTNLYNIDQPDRALHEKEGTQNSKQHLQPMLLMPGIADQGIDHRLLDGNYIEPYLYPPFLAGVFGLAFKMTQDIDFWHAIWLGMLVLGLACVPVFSKELSRWMQAESDLLEYKGLFQNSFLRGLALLILAGFVIENNFFWSQVNIIVMIAVLGSLAFYRRSSAFSAFCLAVAVMIKMTPILFVLLYILDKNRKALAYFMLSSGILGGLSLTGGITHWINFILASSEISSDGRMMSGLLYVWAPSNLSLNGFLHRILPIKDLTYEWLNILIMLCLLTYTLWRYYKETASEIESARPALIYRLTFIILLGSPMTWFHHLIFAIPACLMLWFILEKIIGNRIWLMIAWSVLVFLPLLPYGDWIRIGYRMDRHWIIQGLVSSLHFYILMISFWLPDLMRLLEGPVRRRLQHQS